MHQSSSAAIFFLRGAPFAIDEALSAGIAATACSMLLLAAVLLAMVLLPVGIG